MNLNIKYEDFLEKLDTPVADKKTVAKEVATLTFSKPGELVKMSDLFPFYKGGNSKEINIVGTKGDLDYKWAHVIAHDDMTHLKQKNAEFRIGDFVYLNGNKSDIYRLKKIQSPWRYDLTQYCANIRREQPLRGAIGNIYEEKKNVVLCPKFGNVANHLCGKDIRRGWSYSSLPEERFLYGNVELDYVLSFRPEKKKMTNVKTQRLFNFEGYPYRLGSTSAVVISIEKVDILDMCMKRDEYLSRAETMTSIIQAAAELAKNSSDS